jgi:short-subunit dehydrogenase
MKFAGKVFIVTGASQGIGKELARQLLLESASVIITGRNLNRLEHTSQKFAPLGKVAFVQADMGKWEDCEKVVDMAIQRFGRLDGLIHNAGISAVGKVADLSPNVIDEIIDTNLRGIVYLTKLALPAIRQSKGSILFIGSLAGMHGLPDYSLYSLTKMSLTAFAQSLHIEEARNGVFVGIAQIGFTKNEEHKYTLNAKGEAISIPERNRLLINTREETATNILRQIVNKRFLGIHCKLGYVNSFLVRFFPKTFLRILKGRYKA